MLDLLITNGRIIDGTGAASYPGAVGVEGDEVRIVAGDLSAVEAGRIMDAAGMAICPGFIDMHSHSDLFLLNDPKHEVKLRQGVTTEALGQDGLSYAPISPDKLDPLLRYLAAVNGLPPEGLRWSSVKDFLDLFDGRVACNVVYFVPHAAIRVEAMGWDARLPTEGEMTRMQELVRQGMSQGAFGLSTGLTYVPGCYSDTSELVSLCQPVGWMGGLYVTHARYNLGDRLLDPFREAIAVGQRAGVPVQISHYHSPVAGMGQQMVELLDEARRRGQDVTYDQYPYPAASTLLLSLLPAWVHAGGPGQLLQRIQTRDVRQQLKQGIQPSWGGSWDQYMFSRIRTPQNKLWEGHSVEEFMRAQGKSLVDAVCDLLIEEDLDVAFVSRTGNEQNIRTIARHPAQMVGSDGLLTGDKPNPRSYGTFPYVLGQLVREEGVLTLEQAVAKMTSFPALRLGIHDRGVLSEGKKADIVVFDPKTVRAAATFEEPKQYPEGIRYVIVNGRVVIDDGAHTGALPGRALRRS